MHTHTDGEGQREWETSFAGFLSKEFHIPILLWAMQTQQLTLSGTFPALGYPPPALDPKLMTDGWNCWENYEHIFYTGSRVL